MAGTRWRCGAALLTLAALTSAGAQRPLQEEGSYLAPEPGGGTALLAPHTTLRGEPLAPDQTAGTPEACAAACREAPTCAWFNWCGAEVRGSPARPHSLRAAAAAQPRQPRGHRPAAGSRGPPAPWAAPLPAQAPSPHPAPLPQVGCADGGGGRGALRYQRCRLLRPVPDTSGAALMPLVAGAGDAVAGFPLRVMPPDVPSYVAHPGQGIVGADLDCGLQRSPGACAFASPTEAAIACGLISACRAVVFYSNGA